MKRKLHVPTALLVLAAAVLAAQAPGGVQFLAYEQARPVLLAMAAKLPAELKGASPLTADKWAGWARGEDAKIRERLERGEEDTLTNLLRFGVTFTKEYRIDNEYLARYGKSSLVNAFAENRANDLIRAMASADANEGIAHMRAFLERKGFSFKTPEDRAKIRRYLMGNLARMRDEMLRYIQEAKQGNRFQLFEDRGISLDTNLWPDFLLDQHLTAMSRKGLLRPGSVRRVAIVGPGLDFANKEMGNDFYPPQTIQPFTVLDTLIRLGLSDAAAVDLYTLDISSEVNFHIERARKNAAAGHAYVVQLPWVTTARMTPEYRAAFLKYWEGLGEHIGEAVPPIRVPEAAAGTTETRAVSIRPEIVRRITPLDVDIVFQRPEQREGFDLIIGTNIFIYFGEFEQALARMNMALMLNPGGYILTNDKLSGVAEDGLSDSLITTQTVARNPDRTDFIFTYAHP